MKTQIVNPACANYNYQIELNSLSRVPIENKQFSANLAPTYNVGNVENRSCSNQLSTTYRQEPLPHPGSCRRNWLPASIYGR